MDILKHSIWREVAPYKKPVHLLRINLAKQYAKLYPKSLFVGVTGSVGKTTTVAACNLVLSQKYHCLSTKSNLDPIFNLPITLLKIIPGVKKVILEMGVEYPGEMDFYLKMVAPSTAIVTAIAYQHCEFLGNLKNIFLEKSKLVAQLPKDGLAILNYDDFYVRQMADITKAAIVFFGKDSKNCQVWAGNIKIEDLRTSFEINYGVERVKVNYPLLGEHQIYPALAAAALGLSEGVSLIAIKNALEKMQSQEHRLQALPGFNGSIILDDTYNSAPVSVGAAIDTLQKIPARRRIVVLGEMRELGQFSEELHRKIARKLYQDKVDLVFLGQGEANFVADELSRLGFLEDRMETNLSNPKIVSKLFKVLSRGDVCLIKGARAVRLDEVVKRVIKRKV